MTTPNLYGNCDGCGARRRLVRITRWRDRTTHAFIGSRLFRLCWHCSTPKVDGIDIQQHYPSDQLPSGDWYRYTAKKTSSP